MSTFPPLPDWVKLEHQVALIHYNNKKNMDGILMKALHGNLSKLSDQNFQKLLKYYGGDTLSLPEQCSLLSEITGHKGTYKDAPSLNLNNSTQPQEIK